MSEPLHIFLVDDDRLVLSVLTASLTRAGMRVSTAESAEEAQDMLSGGLRPDLTVLDVRMPGQGGLFLAERLRALDHIPFIMLSAFSDPETVEESTRNGALGYLVKPLTEVQLLPAIDTALARAREMDGLRATQKQLQTALDNERDISVAVGITMVQYRIGRKAAFEVLRKNARSRKIRVAEVASEIASLCESMSGSPDTPKP